jgi:hypothetical protein
VLNPLGALAPLKVALFSCCLDHEIRVSFQSGPGSYQCGVDEVIVEFLQMTCLTTITNSQRQTMPPFKPVSPRKVSAPLILVSVFSTAMYVRWVMS